MMNGKVMTKMSELHITCATSVTNSLLSPKARAASDKIGKCKACGKRNNRKKEVWPSDRMSPSMVYRMAEEKERLKLLMKLKG